MMLNSKRFGDRHFDSVVSLLHFDGANASTTFTDNGRLTWTVNGNAQISTAQGPFGSSGLFDGTGDFLTLTNDGRFQIATGSFTIEAWIRPDTVLSDRTIASQRGSGPNSGWVFGTSSTARLVFVHFSNGGTWGSLTSNASLVINTEYRVAVDFDGTTLRLYINGALDNSTTSFTGSRFVATVDSSIGRDPTNTARDWDGYLAEFRLTKAARYAGAYTPSTEPFPVGNADPFWSSVSCLVQFKGANASTTFWDDVGRVWTASGNAQLTTTTPIVGTASGLFDGNGDYISTNDSNDFNFGAGDFHISARVNPAGWFPDDTYFPAILSQRNNITSNFAFSFEFDGTGTTLNFYASSTGASITFTLTAAHTFTPGVDAYIEVNRSGNDWSMMIDGAVVASATSSFTIFNSTAPVRCGAYDNPVFAKSYFNGRIDEVRVMKGAAQHVAAFTVNPQPAPNYKTIP